MKMALDRLPLCFPDFTLTTMTFMCMEIFMVVFGLATTFSIIWILELQAIFTVKVPLEEIKLESSCVVSKVPSTEPGWSNIILMPLMPLVLILMPI